MVNTEEEFNRKSPFGIPGRELLLEHVHPTIEGHPLLLRSLEFRVKGYMPGKMRTVLRKYGTTTALADKSIDLVRGYNDVVLDMGSIALEKGVERSEERRVGKECRSRWSPYH